MLILAIIVAYQVAIVIATEETDECKLEGYSDRVNCVSWSRDSERLAAGSGRFVGLLQDPRPGELIIWDVKRRIPLQRLTGHKDGVSCVSFSPDGKQLFSADFAGLGALWDSATWKPLQWKRIDAAVLSCSFSKTGERLAIGSWGGPRGGIRNAVYLLDGRTAEVTAVLAGHDEGVAAVAIAPDGKTVVSGGMDGILIVWDIGQKVPRKRLEHGFWIYGLDFSPDGKRLAVVGGNALEPGRVLIYDETLKSSIEVVPVHRDVVRAARFSPDGGALATGDFAGGIRLWDVRGAKPSLVLGKQTGGSVFSIAFSADGRSLAYSGGEAAVVMTLRSAGP